MQSRYVHFLLVEDDDDHAILVQRTLEKNRVVNSLDRVSNGAEAIAYLKREGSFAERRDPDAILLDLKLPKIDGHEVLAWIKDNPELRSTPVIVITTSDAEADRAKAYKHHVNSYLVKPIDFSRFRSMVDHLSYYWGNLNQIPPRPSQS